MGNSGFSKLGKNPALVQFPSWIGHQARYERNSAFAMTLSFSRKNHIWVYTADCLLQPVLSSQNLLLTILGTKNENRDNYRCCLRVTVQHPFINDALRLLSTIKSCSSHIYQKIDEFHNKESFQL